jgi:hypothetical protein
VSTLSQLETLLGELLDVDTTRYPNTSRDLHVNQAVELLSRGSDAPWDEDSGTFSTVIGQAAYALDTALTGTEPMVDHPLRVFYVGSELAPCSREHYLRWYPPGTANGTPVVWCWWGGQLLLGPPPAAVATVTVDFRAVPDPLSGGTDHNAWTDNASGAVLYQAAAIAATFLLEDERRAAFEAAVGVYLERANALWQLRAVTGGRGAAAGTLAQLRDALGDLLQVNTRRYPLEVRDLHLNQAIRALSLESDSPWDERTVAVSFSTGDYDYDPETDLAVDPPLSRPVAIYLTATGKPLQFVSREEWRQRREGLSSSATPTAFTWWGNQLLLVPTPNATTAASLDYRSVPKPLALTTDTNEWTLQASAAVLARAAGLGAVWVGKPEQAQAFQALAAEEMARWNAEWSKRRPRGGRAVAGTLLRLVGSLGSMLEVDEARYPREVRVDHLNQAIRRLALSADAPWDEVQATMNTVAVTQQYDVDAVLGSSYHHFSRPLLISYIDTDGAEIAIEPLTWFDFKDTWPDQTEDAAPQHFALWDEKLWLGPPPDAVYRLQLSYRGLPRALSADTDSNGWTLNATQLVLLTACEIGCGWLGGEHLARVDGYAAVAGAELRRWQLEWSQRNQAARHQAASREPGGAW